MSNGLVSVRSGLEELEKQITRRSLFHGVIKGAGIAAVLDRFGPRLLGQDATDPRLPYKVFSALGQLTIPVDEDPGWATFEPGITNFGVDVFVRQVLLGGNFLAFLGYLSAMSAINEAPIIADYGPRFLTMNHVERDRYYSDILTGQFENDGVQDLLGFAGGLSLIATKATFFSNYPRHQAYPGQEFQVRRPSPVKTGWDIMGLRGPVGPDEEKQLRAKYFDAEILPGVDPENTYI